MVTINKNKYTNGIKIGNEVYFTWWLISQRCDHFSTINGCFSASEQVIRLEGSSVVSCSSRDRKCSTREKPSRSNSWSPANSPDKFRCTLTLVSTVTLSLIIILLNQKIQKKRWNSTYFACDFIRLMVQKVAIVVEVLVLEGGLAYHLVRELPAQIHHKL